MGASSPSSFTWALLCRILRARALYLASSRRDTEGSTTLSAASMCIFCTVRIPPCAWPLFACAWQLVSLVGRS